MGTCYDASIQYYDADLDALYTVYSIMYDKIWETSTIHPSCEYVDLKDMGDPLKIFLYQNKQKHKILVLCLHSDYDLYSCHSVVSDDPPPSHPVKTLCLNPWIH